MIWNFILANAPLPNGFLKKTTTKNYVNWCLTEKIYSQATDGLYSHDDIMDEGCGLFDCQTIKTHYCAVSNAT